MIGCFDACSSCNLHSRGSWVARSGVADYRLNHSLWLSIGLSPVARSAAHHYGRCDDVTEARGKIRQAYDWVPDHCSLQKIDHASACRALDGKQVMVAGDSTAGQLFLSLVLLLGGRFGRNSRRTSAISDLAASACDDRVRLIFVRNDLLLWTDHRFGPPPQPAWPAPAYLTQSIPLCAVLSAPQPAAPMSSAPSLASTDPGKRIPYSTAPPHALPPTHLLPTCPIDPHATSSPTTAPSTTAHARAIPY